ncbi:MULTISPECIES: response regulator [Shewanella]|uniref:Response regulator n=1 Tax=Shewanella japonica TaxID=93973 RepID=A0ABN4YIX6_9GAMM|nr:MULTISPECIES: response regulator [Shewanella]ARD23186.1 response regulator [Shewanella japonica]KPZ69878.1 Regulator of RpoS [Shewanella sp. P1-14-1]MBQ4891189.1 response regulator [Shewanella sp. MMG014]OBT10310.1 two-component system response regulator [Shewanella sp. UCD-FRSSP16_17]
MALTDVAVLLVEDDSVFRQLLADFLVQQGAVVFEAADGNEGVSEFQAHTVDIVIADLSMPKLDGLGMLKQIIKINPAVPSIVISGNNVMADVVEALRYGASDYLVKPLADFSIIEQAILQAISPQNTQLEHLDFNDSDAVINSAANMSQDLSYQELTDNFSLLEHNSEAAKSVQQQLFPASNVCYPSAKIHYSLCKNSDVSAYFIDSTMVGDNHLMMYMAHFHPEDNRAAFGCVLLRSFVNQKLKLFRNGLSTTLIEPFNMLSYLNDRMVNSGINLFVDIVYVCIDLSNFRVAIGQAGSGLRCYLRNNNGLAPLAMSESLQLGTVEWNKPSMQFRTLMPEEKICIASNISQHRNKLLNNEFDGLYYDETVPAGGFIELAVN